MTTIDLHDVGQTIDQYKIVRMIAQTQRNHLYLVEASGLHKTLVLKLFAGELSPIAITQFNDQANLLLEFVQHPHIVNVMHLGHVNERPYMVMPYYPQTLNNLLAVHHQKVSFLTSLEIIKQLLSAVASLHHLRIIHLDIKPQNILLDEVNKVGLTDFDNALVLSDSPLSERFKETKEVSEENSNLGLAYTAEYASPEQSSHEYQLNLIDESSDLYSIGALWFRMLTGNTLFTLSKCEENDDISPVFICNQLLDIAPDWAAHLISDLLHDSALKRPSCKSCLTQIEEHEQIPHINQTVQADVGQISPTVANLQLEIRRILLNEGWVESGEKIRLLASYRLVGVDPSNNAAAIGTQQLQHSLQQLIEECELQLIREYHLSGWFGWLNYVQVLLAKSSGVLSSQQYQKLLQAGRVAQTERTACANDIMKKHFHIKEKSSNFNKRYFIPASIIVLIFLYWALLGQDDINSNRRSSQADSFTNGNILDKPIIQNVIQGSSLVNDNVSGNESDKNGTYKFVFTTGNAVSSVNTDWVKVKSLPNIKVMATEITADLYSVCVAEGACSQAKKFSTAASHRSNQQLKSHKLAQQHHPKVNISWYDITEQFIPWLNQKTGKNFVLPSYQQWLAYSEAATNDQMMVATAHCKDCRHSQAIQYSNRTMPVGAVNADLFGLYHIFGNVQEWLSDCWQSQSLDGLTVDRCDQAMVAGGSWMSNTTDLQNNHVTQLLKTAKTPTTGFRLIEVLND